VTGPDPNKTRIIVDWLATLAELVPMSADLNREVVLPSLVQFCYADFRSNAFTPASLRDVAAQNEFFPTYHTLHKQLATWCRTYLPPMAVPTVMPTPARTLAPPEPYTRADVERQVAILREHPHRAMLLSIYRDQLERNFPEGVPIVDAATRGAEAVLQPAEDAPAPEPPPPAYQARQLTPKELLAVYEAAGQGDSVRAATLRAQIAGAS
jgi:hypothetical protein